MVLASQTRATIRVATRLSVFPVPAAASNQHGRAEVLADRLARCGVGQRAFTRCHASPGRLEARRAAARRASSSLACGHRAHAAGDELHHVAETTVRPGSQACRKAPPAKRRSIRRFRPLARLSDVERHPGIAVPRPAGPERSSLGADARDGSPAFSEQLFEGKGVERVLEAAGRRRGRARLQEPERGAGLAESHDLEGAVGIILIDPVDRAAEREGAPAAGVDHHRLPRLAIGPRISTRGIPKGTSKKRGVTPRQCSSSRRGNARHAKSSSSRGLGERGHLAARGGYANAPADPGTCPRRSLR